MAPPPPSSEPPEWVRAAQSGWSNTGRERPPFALEPGPGQESVWDYPRPPALVADGRSVTVASRTAPDRLIAETHRSLRLLETASPPTFYIPPDAVAANALVQTPGQSFCEWKGPARYFALDTDPSTPVAWTYEHPYAPYEALAGWIAFYPAQVHCRVDGEVVRPQAGGFYGGWITNEVVGPFKGEPGTSGW